MNAREQPLFGKTYFVFVALGITFAISSLVLFLLDETLLAVLFSALSVLFAGLTVGAFSTTISKFIAERFHMDERFKFITIEELRREDNILLGALGPLQMTISFVMNFYGEIAEIQVINGMIILSVVVFYLIRASAKLKDSNYLRFISIVIPIFLGFIDVVITMWILHFDFLVQYGVSTTLTLVISLIFAVLKPRYIQNKGEPKYVI
ncbi:MAG: hypothetical protein ACFFCW_36120 [Candidatus Hodarchaeota archaeon]